MQTKNLRLFWLALFMTLLIFSFLAAFFLVDSIRLQFHGTAAASAVELHLEDPLDPQLDFLGQEYTLSPGPLEQLDGWRKRYACLTTPRLFLLWEQLQGWIQVTGENLYDSYLEKEYLQNVINSSKQPNS